ncbi:MAG: N-acetylglucosaminyldiphosphoundecaprenol [Microgenomates group bacterium Gr01-1014_7]|nr:MAG: N-acetylglucosaminyldiphosphoundecaprenol [Microgenomates group bacterium Gr01-1014_7]
MKKNVLGVKIDDVSIPEIVNIVEGWLKKPGKYYIVTPNPEIVMMAQKDAELKRIINQADLAIPDGRGLKLTGDIVNNSPGIDVMERLIKELSEKGAAAGFLGGKGDVAEKTAECLKRKYPKLQVSFATSGGEVNEDGKLLRSLKLLKADLLFVAFGPPKQEKWIAKNLPELPIKVAMGVGGAFDYISGKVPRAPQWIRDLGMEWLFRLIIQPWRIRRQLSLIKYLLMLR